MTILVENSAHPHKSYHSNDPPMRFPIILNRSIIKLTNFDWNVYRKIHVIACICQEMRSKTFDIKIDIFCLKRLHFSNKTRKYRITTLRRELTRGEISGIQRMTYVGASSTFYINE